MLWLLLLVAVEGRRELSATSRLQPNVNRLPHGKKMLEELSESGKGKVNYSSAAEGLVALAENVTGVTGKIKATPKQERIIQGVSECARGAGDLLMQVSPALGPACPFVFGIGLAFNVAGGVVMSITSAPSEGKPEALQYNASGLQEKVEQNFQHMGWEFQLTMLSLKKVQEEMEDLVQHLARALEDIDLQLAGLRKQLVSLQVQPSLDAMAEVATVHRDYLQSLTEGDPVTVLAPYVPRLVALELSLRSVQPSAVNRLAACVACGGRAAAALWVGRFLQARYEVWTMLWHFRQVTNDLDQVAVMVDHLREDQLLWPRLWDSTGLTPWLRLPSAELSKYLITSKQFFQVQGLLAELTTGSWAARLAAAEAVVDDVAFAALAPALEALLEPPPSAWASQNQARSDFFGKNVEQAACRRGAEALEVLGYPAAWPAKVRLERLVNRSWSKTRSDGTTLTVLSPCAIASRKTLETLEAQELKMRF